MVPNEKYKTVLCRYWQSNRVCPLGEKCHFAHGKEDMRKIGENAGKVPMIQNPKFKTPNMQGGQNNYNNYKTVKCKYFDLNLCKNGPNCTFAHGDQDLRRPGQMMNQGRAKMPQNNYNSIDELVKVNQIKFMVTKLSEMYKSNSMVENVLNSSLNFLASNQIEEAANTLQKIVYDQSASPDKKQAHYAIIEQARDYGLSLMKNNSIDSFGRGMGQQPPDQMSMQMNGGLKYYNSFGQ